MLMAHLYRLFDYLRTWCLRYRSRRQLGKLGACMRRDIGITAEQAREEARKPFWRA